MRLAEAVPVTGGLMLELLELDGTSMPGGPRRPGRKPVARRAARARAKSAKGKRKVVRKRR